MKSFETPHRESDEHAVRLIGRSLALSKTLSTLAAAISLLAVAGWAFRIEELTRIHPSLPAMQLNTALALVLCAIAIMSTTKGDRGSEKGAIVASVIAAMVSLLGLLTLGEYAFSRDLGIDRLLIGRLATAGGLHPGRLSPQSAANFAMLGVALFVYNLRSPAIRIGQALALLVGSNAVIAMTGYIFSTREFYGFPSISPDIGMAIPTATSFILLVLALLGSRPNDGMMSLVTSDTRSGRMARRILLTGLLAPPLVGVLTRIGVYENWYGASFQISLFALVIVILVLRTTWAAARQSEHDELRAKAAFSEAQTANERLKKALDERQVFLAFIENSSDFIGLADAVGKPIYLNPAGRRMVGLSSDFPVEQVQIQDCYPPGLAPFVTDVILKTMIERGRWQGETYFRHWQTQEAIPVSDEHFLIQDPGTERVLGMGTITRDISEIKRSQDLLRQSEERLDFALRGADLGAWDWNIRSGEVIFNSRWADMRGFQLEEVKPHVDSWISGVHPDDLPQVQRKLSDYFQGVISEYEVEFRALTRSGDWIWILDRGKVFSRDENGQPIRMVGTELDITERKRLEEDLRLAEAKSSGIVSISADAIISVDENQRIILFNEGAEKIFGYSKAEAMGASLDFLIPERFRPLHREHAARFTVEPSTARRMGQRATPILGRRKNGEEFPADAAISKLDVGGKSIMTVALRDITDQKRVENEHRFLAQVGAVLTSSLGYEETLTNIAQLVVRDLADYCILDAVDDLGEMRRLRVCGRAASNQWVCDLFKQVALDGRRPSLVTSIVENRATVLLPIQPLEISRYFDEESLRALRAADAKSLMAVPLLAHGELLGVITLISSSGSRIYGATDVRLTEELAQRAALSIQNALLFRDAQRAIRTREDVLAIVSHDLGNPVTSIDLIVHLLRRLKRIDADQVRQFADQVQIAVDEMKVLIADLLDFAKIQSGTFSVVPSPNNLSEIVIPLIDRLRTQSDSKKQTLDVNLPLTLPRAALDARRINQVISNLVRNAIKFTPSEGSIRVSAQHQGQQIVVSVGDTGPGISEGDLANIFDRFWRAEGVTEKGSGLGLAIAKGIVEAHGGTIWAESQLGNGSSFFFTLPLAGVDRIKRPNSAAFQRGGMS